MTTQITTAYDRLNRLAAQQLVQHKLRLPDLDFLEAGWDRALEAVEHLPYEELGCLVAADPDRKRNCFQTELGRNWLHKAGDSTQLLQRLAAMAVVSRLQQLCETLPVFEHHCSDCRYLGRMERQSHSDYMFGNVHGKWVDLHACTVHGRPVVEVRYRDGHEYCYTGSLDIRNDADPYLQEAWRRFDEMVPVPVSR